MKNITLRAFVLDEFVEVTGREVSIPGYEGHRFVAVNHKNHHYYMVYEYSTGLAAFNFYENCKTIKSAVQKAVLFLDTRLKRNNITLEKHLKTLDKIN